MYLYYKGQCSMISNSYIQRQGIDKTIIKYINIMHSNKNVRNHIMNVLKEGNKWGQIEQYIPGNNREGLHLGIKRILDNSYQWLATGYEQAQAEFEKNLALLEEEWKKNPENNISLEEYKNVLYEEGTLKEIEKLEREMAILDFEESTRDILTERKIKNIDIKKLWEFDANWKFIFFEWVEKTDKVWRKYINIEHMKFYENMKNWLWYLIKDENILIWEFRPKTSSSNIKNWRIYISGENGSMTKWKVYNHGVIK